MLCPSSKHAMRSFLYLLIFFQSSFGLYLLGDKCPSVKYENVNILWTEYASFYIKKYENGTLDGLLPRIIETSLNTCCSRLNHTFVKVESDVTDDKEQMLLKAVQNSNNTIQVFFPILVGNFMPDFTLFQFIPFKVSPGPMVLGSTHSLKENFDTVTLIRTWLINPVFYLILAMISSAGVIFWILVRKRGWS